MEPSLAVFFVQVVKMIPKCHNIIALARVACPQYQTCGGLICEKSICGSFVRVTDFILRHTRSRHPSPNPHFFPSQMANRKPRNSVVDPDGNIIALRITGQNDKTDRSILACPIDGCGETSLLGAIGVKKHLLERHGWTHLGAPCAKCAKIVCIAAQSQHACNAAPKKPRIAPTDATFAVDGVGVGVYEGSLVGYVPGAGRRRFYWHKCALPDCGCGEYFDHAQAWSTHKAGVTGVKKFPCEFCGTNFANTSDCRKHSAACKGNPDQKPETCAGCSRVYRNGPAVRNHHKYCDEYKIKMGREKKVVCCLHPGCEFEGPYQSVVDFHYRTVHCTDRPFVCEVEGCLVACKTQAYLNKHMVKHIPTREYVCEMPKGEGYDRSNRKRRRTSSPCGRSFKSEHQLDVHQRLKHGERRFPCSECCHVAKSNVSLKTHWNAFHEKPESWYCTECNLHLYAKRFLENHMFIVHGVGTGYPCGQCGELFGENTLRRKHEQIHTLGKPLSVYISADEAEVGNIMRAPESALMTMEDPFAVKVVSQFRYMSISFDYAVLAEPNESVKALVEYDGGPHFRPWRSTSLAGQLAFLKQVHRDMNKSRLCRRDRIPLIRFTSDYLAADVDVQQRILDSIDEFFVPPAFQDYVLGNTFLGPLVKTALKGLVNPGTPTYEDAALLLSMLKTAGTLPIDDVEHKYWDAITAVFIRENYKKRIDELDAPTAAAFRRMLTTMPEFNQCSGDEVAAGDDDGEDIAEEDNVCDDDDDAGARIRVSSEVTNKQHQDALDNGIFMRCPHCPGTAPFRAGTEGAMALHRHMCVTHGPGFPIKCRACNTEFKSFDDLMTHMEHAHRRFRVFEFMCARCNVAFDNVQDFFRHCNDAHDASFPHGCTLRCPTCAVESATHARHWAHVKEHK